MTLVNSLLHIDPTLVSRAALTVQEFVITGGQSAQLQAILTGIQDSTNTGLKSLTVQSGSLVLVSPDVLAGAAVKLERLEVRSRLSYVQVEAILARVAATQDSRLRRFNYDQSLSDLSGLDPEVVAQALVKLETVGYPSLGVDLSPDQTLALFTRIREAPDLRLTELGLTWDVSQVPPEVFAEALSRLETVFVGYRAGVTPSQLESLFLRLISHQEEAGGSDLKKLRLIWTDLTSVSPEILVGAIQKLEEVVILHGMTVEQITAVLTMVKEKQHGRLQRFGIGIGLGSVSPSLIQEASLNKILKFKLGYVRK